MTHLDRDTLALVALAELELSAAEREHLADCPACTGELDALRRTVLIGRAAGSVDLVQPADAVWGRIHAALGLSDAVLAPPSLDESDVSDRDLVDRDLVDRDLVDRDLVDRDLADRDVADRDLADRDLADRDLADRNLADRDVADRDLADRDVADRDVAAGELAGQGDAAAGGALDTELHTESAAAEPATAEATHAGHRRTKPAHAAPARADGSQTEPAHAVPAPSAPASAGPASAEPAQAAPAHAEPVHAGPAAVELPQAGRGPASVADLNRGPAFVVDLNRRRRRAWVPIAAAACAVGLVGGIAGGAWWQSTRVPAPETVIAQAQLDALPGWTASGSASIEETPDGRREVVVDLVGGAGADGIREVWLLTPDAKGLVSVGLLDGDTGRFSIPAGLDLAEYPVVDVSAEPADGNPTHSGDSIVRGTLNTL